MAKITQPRNTSAGSYNVSFSLVWSQTFARKQSGRFDNAQKYVDSECIRLMAPYTPARNNQLYKTAVLGTKIGSGHIHYTSPYARYQYYGVLMVSSVTGSAYARHGEAKIMTSKMLVYSKFRHPKAVRRWFEVMKLHHKAAMIAGTNRIAGGANH